MPSGSTFRLIHHDKVNALHRFRAELIQRRQILPAETLQLLPPRLIGDRDREYTIGKSDGIGSLRGLASTSQRPRQQGGVLAFAAQCVSENLSQSWTGMLHGELRF